MLEVNKRKHNNNNKKKQLVSCGQLPVFVVVVVVVVVCLFDTSRLPWWISPLQGSIWKTFKMFILEEKSLVMFRLVFFFIFLFYFQFIYIFNWRIITLQPCDSFCHISI